jgi:hypothetical protein
MLFDEFSQYDIWQLLLEVSAKATKPRRMLVWTLAQLKTTTVEKANHDPNQSPRYYVVDIKQPIRCSDRIHNLELVGYSACHWPDGVQDLFQHLKSEYAFPAAINSTFEYLECLVGYNLYSETWRNY